MFERVPVGDSAYRSHARPLGQTVTSLRISRAGIRVGGPQHQHRDAVLSLHGCRNPRPCVPDDQSVEHETHSDEEIVVPPHVRQTKKVEDDEKH